MNPQEAQQAQTIAGIRKRHEIDSADFDLMSVDELFKDRATLLEIVDSQAQKIAEARQAAESIRARYTARIAGGSQAKHYERADLLFPWEKQ